MVTQVAGTAGSIYAASYIARNYPDTVPGLTVVATLASTATVTRSNIYQESSSCSIQ